jgi:cell division protein ZapB
MSNTLCLKRLARLAPAIDPSPPVRALLACMSPHNKNQPVETELQRLEVRIGELLSLVQQLTEENTALRHRQDSLATERASLVQKNEQVRTRVEAMIGRLRALETGA